MSGDQLSALQALDKLGTAALAFILWAIMRGDLVTRRENNREIARGDKLEARLDRALELSDRAVNAGRVMADKLPAKK